MNYIVRIPISNHPTFTDVERHVRINRIAENADVKQIVIDACVDYTREGVDISSGFKQKVPNWIIDNSYSVTVRDANNEPMTDNEGNVITMPAFDYFHSLIMANEVPLLTLLTINVQNDDDKGSFNF